MHMFMCLYALSINYAFVYLCIHVHTGAHIRTGEYAYSFLVPDERVGLLCAYGTGLMVPRWIAISSAVYVHDQSYICAYGRSCRCSFAHRLKSRES